MADGPKTPAQLAWDITNEWRTALAPEGAKAEDVLAAEFNKVRSGDANNLLSRVNVILRPAPFQPVPCYRVVSVLKPFLDAVVEYAAANPTALFDVPEGEGASAPGDLESLRKQVLPQSDRLCPTCA